MKQTAVEWLVKEIEENNAIAISINNFDIVTQWIPISVIDQAKEMEKKQIIKAIDYCRDKYIDSENYYNETYGGNK
jgi:hypothetical protein